VLFYFFQELKKRERFFLTQKRKGRRGRIFFYWQWKGLLEEELCLVPRLQTVR
jgi:hypothetical protein